MDVDVCVVGAGVFGSAIARALKLHNPRADVVVLERFEAGHDHGASHGSHRILRLSQNAAEDVARAKRAVELWRQLETETGRSIIGENGLMEHGREVVLQKRADAMGAADVAFEEIDASDGKWPGPVIENRALHHRQGGTIAADEALHAFHESAQSRGVEFRYSSPLLNSEETAAGVRVVTDDSSIEARIVVLAVGAWVHQVAPASIAELLPPVTVTEERPSFFKVRSGSALDWPSFVHHRDGHPTMYGLPVSANTIKVGAHATGLIVEPDRTHPNADASVEKLIVDYVSRWLPGLDPTIVRTERCLYDMTPDERFILVGFGSYYVAAGSSGHGFKYAPEVGEHVADWVVSRLRPRERS